MDKAASDSALSAEIRDVLSALGRALGAVSIYGFEHPSVVKFVDQTFELLQLALKDRKAFSIGTFDGKFTVNETPVTVLDVPIRTLEKKLTTLKISHLTFSRGMPKPELVKLLTLLCTSNDTQMKEKLAGAGLNHIQMTDVKYVALRSGEQKTGSGGGNARTGGEPAGATDRESSVQISQIVAFLKGETGGSEENSREIRKMLSDPEKLGQMILEAAAVRQAAGSARNGETMADLIVGCLRRTFDGLNAAPEFQSAQGKASLAKTMLLLEKTVLDRIRGSAGPERFDLERRIQAGIHSMESQRQFEVLSTYYAEQCKKRQSTEEKMLEFIRAQGEEKAREMFAASSIPFADWQQLIIKSHAAGGSGSGAGGDLAAVATVLERLAGLMSSSRPEEAQTAIREARREVADYTGRLGRQIEEIEEQLQRPGSHPENARHPDREKLLLEISKLTLSIMQPLTVVNGSIEAALTATDDSLRKELLELAYQSGQTIQVMTGRMIALTGYPSLQEADGHLAEFKASL